MNKEISVIYGPPGTGKTYEMIRRVGETAREGLDFMFCSFTRAAAKEGLDRLGGGLASRARTIHSLAFETCGVTKSRVVDELKLKEFSKLIGHEITGKDSDRWAGEITDGDEMMGLVNLAEARMKSVKETFDHNPISNVSWSMLKVFSDGYVKWKEMNGYMDFNDMLVQFIALNDPYATDTLYVDEAQDLSPLQWTAINKIKCKHLVVAGDDDQSIHQWAGADPHGMAALGGEEEVLAQSHRVPGAVHRLAAALISRVRVRKPKRYLSRAEEGSVERVSDPSHLDPALFSEGTSMFLFRNHSQRAVLEEYLVQNRIPYAAEGKPSMFHSRLANLARAYETLRKGGAIKESTMRVLKDKISSKNLEELKLPWWVAIREGSFAQVDYLKNVDLFEEPRARLSTIHAAKGMEADNVVLLTNMGALTWEQMARDYDAEWRVWYVGVTRARHNLFIINSGMGVDI